MSDSTTIAAPATPAAAKVKTVANDMDRRRIFDTPELAINYLTNIGETISDFGKYPLASPGVDAEGNFDPAIYTSDMRVMVAVLSKKKGGAASGPKCIVIAPIPKLESLLSDAAGMDWVQSIVETQLNHVAVRVLREAEDISTVVDQMPTTRGAYITSGRESAGIMVTFDELYKSILNIMNAKIPLFAKARLTKGELKKAYESKGYALEYYASLEDRGAKDSLFVTALSLSINAAKSKGLDPTIFERWLETRDAKVFTPGEETDEDDFDLDSLTESLLTAPAPAAEPADVPPTEPAPAPTA